MAAPKQTDPQFKLRLTPELKTAIERAADSSGRSMNAEIVARLEESFSDGEKTERTLIAVMASMEEATEEAKLRRLEFRAMASHMALMKHIAARLAELHQGALPHDLEALLKWMREETDAPEAGSVNAVVLLEQAVEALDKLAEAQLAQESPDGQKRRETRAAQARAAGIEFKRHPTKENQ